MLAARRGAAMRKMMAGLLLGGVALSFAAGAVAATSAPFASVKTVGFGQMNNRAVLGLQTVEDDDCARDTAGEGCDPGVDLGGGNSLPIVIGVGVAVGGVAFAAGSGGGSGGSGGGGGGGPSSP